MAHASLVPTLDTDIHLVLCDFGRSGLAYVETDPAEAENHPREPSARAVRTAALNADEGWSRDVSEAIAARVRDVAEREGGELTSGTLAFIEAPIGRVVQPTLPRW
jgi:hypothetical protein